MTDGTQPRPTRTTRFHRALGALALIVFILMMFVDMFPNYTVRPSLAVLLVASFMTLLGFGHVFGELLNLYGGSNVTRTKTDVEDTSQNDTSDDDTTE